MQKILLFLLRFFARLIITRHKPIVIGVTGTVGKTTITTHVARLLTHVYGDEQVGVSRYHYNGEYGLPLTIIGAKTWAKNPFKWIFVFFIAIARLFMRYPKYLVLEYGIDHPGEMSYLISVVSPYIAIVSPIAPNHLEQFGTLEKYREEKLVILTQSKYGLVHDSLTLYVEKRENLEFYGIFDSSDIIASDLWETIQGVSWKISYSSHFYDLEIPAFWSYQMENILPLFGIAHKLGFSYEKIREIAPLLRPEEGRSRILRWIETSTIIDGSYNGGYESITAWIISVLPFAASHRIVLVLWDMRELWDHAEILHREIAHYIDLHCDPKEVSVFLVGPLSRSYIEPLLREKFEVRSSLSSREIGREVENMLRTNPQPTLIYVKGSQNTIFLEEAIKEFLSKDESIDHLCRQSEEWMKKKLAFFQTVEK
jgi:UDP-N-acetylmuramoyl-tripeptide--D-alanyl-D-alanine ligase